MRALVREEPDSGLAREHGGSRDAELRALGIDLSEIVDFSVNVNPYGPSPGVVCAIREASIERYPDSTAWAARQALARTYTLDAEEILLGNGAADLLWTIARLLLRPDATALVVEPTFSEFRSAALSVGARVLEWRAKATDGFAVDLKTVSRLLERNRAGVLYLCAPNTPTGVSIPVGEIAALAAAEPGVAVVLDQSFISLSDRFADAQVRLPENVFCVRSLTKDHAIPGVRVGYLVASPTAVQKMELSRPAWTTSAAAQAAVIAACREGPFVAESRRRLSADRDRLATSLRALGLDPVPSSAPFLLVRINEGSGLRRRLLARHRILVRDCRSFGLPEFIRLAARPSRDVERLKAALAEELR
ncbi:MAG: histidinol-phosphate aminotransferase family protein [Deltaproteobacteria bacterium]|nr:histidinol-phosphate aminotransferase family protein [Deltaproteobacteria bacterium]